MSCYGNSYNTGSCYNPSGSSCYPNTAYLCAPPQPCRQTVFRSGNGGPNVVLTGSNVTPFPDGSCTDFTNFQIAGSGLSIVGICIGNIGSTIGTFNVCTAGTIGSCPNNFTSTFYLNTLTDGSLPSPVLFPAVGCINWCVCGCNVCGTGTFTGMRPDAISDPSSTAFSTYSGTVQVQGSACSSCGTRNICINNITISG